MHRHALLFVAAVTLGCGPKQTVAEAPREGWQKEEGWRGECWFPKNFDALGPGDRKIERQRTLEAMLTQWGGQRGDGVSFAEDDVTMLETVLLGQPNDIEAVAVQNLQECRKAMASGDTGAWSAWVRSTPARLTEGQCKSPPMRYTAFSYLDIAASWQFPVQVCAGDRVRVKGSTIDFYRITDKGPWINVEGDRGRPTSGAEWPCNVEGCIAGALTMRFTDYDGVVTVLPVGSERIFEVPNHGRIEVMINDVEFHDNKYKQEGGLVHHTSIEYSHAE